MFTDLKKFTSLFNSLALRSSSHTIFSDFLTIAICALSGERYEEEYLEIIKKYKPNEVNIFCEMFGEMVILMDGSGTGFVDMLGEFFTINITRGQNGQFFTPQHITDLMAQLTGNSETKEVGKTVLDPACGSGRTLLSFAKFNGKDNVFFAGDVDLLCAKMCVINLCLNGMRGEVAHMNSLSMEIFSVYEIFYDASRLFVPTIRKMEIETSVFFHEKEQMKEIHKKKMEEIIFADKTGMKSLPTTQLSFNLFEAQEV